jgi:Holliday junction DNA helicase RuvB
MEDYALDIIVGKGPSARTLRMPLERFTLVGATTKLNMLSNPLRDRFGHIYHFRFYEQSHMEHIIARNASLLDLSIDDAGTTTIAKRARRTPRIANRLLKRVRDYAEVHHQGTITKDIALTAFDLLQIDPLGLNHADRLILRTIADQFDGGPVGLRTLAAATSEDAETIESIIEPYLLQLGLMDRTPRGRTITPKAREHLIAFPF